MSNETTTQIIPNGPADERQRAYLSKLIDLSERLAITMNGIETYSKGATQRLTAGCLPTGSMLILMGEALELRGLMEGRLIARSGFGLTEEQTQYAITLGATGGSMSDESAGWLHSGTPSN